MFFMLRFITYKWRFLADLKHIRCHQLDFPSRQLCSGFSVTSAPQQIFFHIQFEHRYMWVIDTIVHVCPCDVALY